MVFFVCIFNIIDKSLDKFNYKILSLLYGLSE